MSSPLVNHSWSLQYVHLKLFAIIIRSAVMPGQWWEKICRTLPDGIVCAGIHAPSRDIGRSISIELYESTGRDITKPAPVLINMHGSGFMIPSLGTDSEFCALVAARTPCVVFDIDYRKSPEYPYPAALHDVEDVLVYLAAHPDQFDTGNIFVSGFSAGGNLAVAISALLGPERVKGVVAIYPPLDFTKRHPAPEKRMLSGSTLPDWLCDRFDDSYILPDQPKDDPRLSPLFAPADQFPKHVYLACGDADPLYQASAELAQKLHDAGHQDVKFDGIEQEGHAFDKFAKKGSVSAAKKDKMYSTAADMISRAIGTS
ncbi:hypothetical protein HWV62_15082 [Athelia sp. TMB]|nr:hypothetical protein HWV62_15082 [Athelia sp. TMB]